MESLQAQWERKTFDDYDRRCCAEDAYNRAIEREIECIEEDISNGDSDTLCAFSEKMFDDDEFLKAVALGADYEEMRINQKENDRSASKEQEQKLNEFQVWLMSGIIDPQRAREIIELYYKEMPF